MYRIKIKEQLEDSWAEWFAPLEIQSAPDGQTLLVGPLRDQSELHSILTRVHNLNLTLISVDGGAVTPDAGAG